MSFIIVQILFTLIYSVYLNNCCDFITLAIHSLNSAVSLDTGQILDEFSSNTCYKDDVYVISTIQIIFSWLYLGLLISSLYQRL
ncbi:MAG TPA: hypothetical protein VFF33_08755, partial [Ignavibacteriaceae bacterium]|nr:hypothetical protein [Ignavibacteriaceae bacterium]